MTKTYKSRQAVAFKSTIQLEFEPNRLEQNFLQLAYAHLVPVQSRQLRTKGATAQLELSQELAVAQADTPKRKGAVG